MPGAGSSTADDRRRRHRGRVPVLVAPIHPVRKQEKYEFGAQWIMRIRHSSFRFEGVSGTDSDSSSKRPGHVGRARVGRAVGRARIPERAPTSVLRVGAEAPPPVFVDPSGVRPRRLRRLAYLLGVVLLLVLLILWWTQLGRPVEPPSTSSCTATAPNAAPAGTGC